MKSAQVIFYRRRKKSGLTLKDVKLLSLCQRYRSFPMRFVLSLRTSLEGFAISRRKVTSMWGESSSIT
ncbi:hypothetical protein CEXT_258191 [Caerostris extrusa]|uniref:Uncharacterized protein n=1 Tax=Caerostris extrusa TaxID=172846 RepID=A0AAV4P1B5_CAEEX|nr:hypothetical protein CEXT_258191 [Caerostris extrusa]